MALCRRHPGLKATIVDLPGSARIGREIVSGTGMDERVHHVEGDMFEVDLGGHHDGALCFTWLAETGFGPARKDTFRTLLSLAMVSAKAV